MVHLLWKSKLNNKLFGSYSKFMALLSLLLMINKNRLFYVYNNMFNLLNKLDIFYLFLCSVVLFCFLYLRIPYLYGVLGFILFIFMFMGPMFLSLFFNRMEGGIDKFFSSLLPSGTPLWIAPFVGLAESISYMVRPLVLMMRPFLNITIGIFGGMQLASLFLSNSYLMVFLIFLFLYEIFVAMVHWFMVVKILSFSMDH